MGEKKGECTKENLDRWEETHQKKKWRHEDIGDKSLRLTVRSVRKGGTKKTEPWSAGNNIKEERKLEDMGPWLFSVSHWFTFNSDELKTLEERCGNLRFAGSIGPGRGQIREGTAETYGVLMPDGCLLHSWKGDRNFKGHKGQPEKKKIPREKKKKREGLKG